jgi:hypothetical protein
MNTIRPAALLVLTVIGASCSRAPKSIREMAGCYAVTMGAWALHPRNLSQPTSPPDTVELGTELVQQDGATARYAVSPHAFDPAARGAASSWTRVGDSVIIDWSVAYAGVELRLMRSDSGLVGSLASRTDVVVSDENGQLPWPSARVYLRPSRCAAAA